MKWSHKYFFLLWLVFVSTHAVNGQDYELPSSAETNLESVKKGGSTFDYNDEEMLPKKNKKESESSNSKNEKARRDKANRNLKIGQGVIKGLKILAFLVLILLIGFIIYQIIGSASKRKNKDYDAISVNFAKKDLSTKLEEELGEGAYRLACRTLYLQLLQKMVDWRLIIWRNEKTNWDYYYEAKDAMLSQNTILEQITQSYDLLWYGLQEPSAQEFNQFKEHVNQLLNEK
jgi:hypothetical protein